MRDTPYAPFFALPSPSDDDRLVALPPSQANAWSLRLHHTSVQSLLVSSPVQETPCRSALSSRSSTPPAQRLERKSKQQEGQRSGLLDALLCMEMILSWMDNLQGSRIPHQM
ncbi:hypothetical protein AB1Y20_009242 [Prymnesium parvum]|uniref:Uncharacterized protein n=1 Tax=Prymnesium parvum TaxID=97485 RepID=A0AB34K4I0_PRYPA